MKYLLNHQTRYSYSEPVSLCHNQAFILPRETEYQQCLSQDLTIHPKPTIQSLREDFFGNHIVYFSIDHPHRELSVAATSEIEIQADIHRLGGDSPCWENVRDHLHEVRSDENLDAKQYLYDSPLISADEILREFALTVFDPGKPIVEAGDELMGKIYSDFVYDPNFTTISTPLAEVLEHKRGVCQDFAHLAIGCLRSLGLPARYVSGYIETLPAPGEEKLEGSDASHAWFSVYVPSLGWVDFDPTNNKIPHDQHITTAWGRDFSDVSPLKGVIFGGGKNQLEVKVDVKRLDVE